MFAWIRRIRREKLEKQHLDAVTPIEVEGDGQWLVCTDRGVTIGSLQEVIDAFAVNGVLYRYDTDEGVEHAHDFNEVLRAVLLWPEGFSVDAYREDYSAQERALLCQLRDLVLATRAAGKPLPFAEIAAQGPKYLKSEMER